MTITSPTGRTYNWTKQTPPTQADYDGLVAFDKAQLPKKGLSEVEEKELAKLEAEERQHNAAELARLETEETEYQRSIDPSRANQVGRADKPMHTYRVETNQGVFDVEADREPTVEELQQHLTGQAQQQVAASTSQQGVIYPSQEDRISQERAGQKARQDNERHYVQSGQRRKDNSALFDNTFQVALPSLAGVAGPAVSGAVSGAGETVVQARRKLMGEQEGINEGEIARATAMGSVPFNKARGVIAAMKNAGRLGVAGAASEQMRSVMDEGKLVSAGETAKAGVVPASIAAAVPAAGKFVAKVTGRVAPEDIARVVAERSRNAVEDSTLAAMAQRGAVIRPSHVNPSAKNKFLESVAGPTATETAASIKNAPVINAVAREEASIAPNVAMQASVMAGARAELAKPYERIAELSKKAQAGLAELQRQKFTSSDPHELAVQKADPATLAKMDPLVIQAAADVEALKQARFDAKDAWKQYRAFGEAAVRKEAEALTAKVAKLESNIEEAAKLIGEPELVDQLRNSRRMIARNHDIEDVVNIGSGDVNARELMAMRVARGPGSMSGGSEDIAKFAAAFPDEVRPRAGINTSPSAVTAGSGMMTAATVASATGNPAGVWAGGIPYLREPVRDYILSPRYQAKNAVRPYRVPTSAEPKLIEAIVRAEVLRRNGKKKE